MNSTSLFISTNTKSLIYLKYQFIVHYIKIKFSFAHGSLLNILLKLHYVISFVFCWYILKLCTKRIQTKSGNNKTYIYICILQVLYLPKLLKMFRYTEY